MKLAPIGVFALIADIVSKTGVDVVMPLGLYIGTVLTGLAIHAIFILPMIVMVFGRFSPIRLLAQISPALAMAFSTSSSVATLPITMDCLNKKTRLPNRITSFVCSLGTTINMDGTAVYQAVTALFIAQIYGIQLTFFQLGVVIVTATLASIGAAALPSAGLITIVIILNTLGLPLEAMGLILAVDRIMDMFRTMVNVFSE